MSNKKNILFASCEEAKQICDKVQYGEATFIEKMKLNLRLMWCRATKSYTKKNRNLTQLCNKAEIKTLNPDKKEEMRKNINSKC
ncbi:MULTISPECIES: hypothetical protein [Galbibacter]|uniref:Glycine dehydrogenase n=1 Tax=Galbibacter pacificus TaxID=2996052 RepID=A0ABT6FM32_9FLAO|nr:hypothetical protein [Galbibacter pacificus]MDG3580843.1 hypothetical protein [Galbibacter pacificus]MDG3584321.1 hypothetical protein [Galbibacter pacificus]